MFVPFPHGKGSGQAIGLFASLLAVAEVRVSVPGHVVQHGDEDPAAEVDASHSSHTLHSAFPREGTPSCPSRKGCNAGTVALATTSIALLSPGGGGQGWPVVYPMPAAMASHRCWRWLLALFAAIAWTVQSYSLRLTGLGPQSTITIRQTIKIFELAWAWMSSCSWKKNVLYFLEIYSGIDEKLPEQMTTFAMTWSTFYTPNIRKCC